MLIDIQENAFLLCNELFTLLNLIEEFSLQYRNDFFSIKIEVEKLWTSKKLIE